MRLIKENLNYLLIAVFSFLIIVTSEVLGLLGFTFSNIYYGLLTNLFGNFISIVFLIIILIVFSKKFINKKLPMEANKSDELLNIKRVLIISAIIIVVTLLTAFFLEWTVKVAYFLGDNTSLLKILLLVVEGAKYLFYLYLGSLIIKHSHQFLLNVLPNFKYKKYIPFGGFVLMLTLGVFGVIFPIFGIPWLNFFHYLLFGVIYLLTNHNTKKTFFLMIMLTLI